MTPMTMSAATDRLLGLCTDNWLWLLVTWLSHFTYYYTYYRNAVRSNLRFHQIPIYTSRLLNLHFHSLLPRLSRAVRLWQARASSTHAQTAGQKDRREDCRKVLLIRLASEWVCKASQCSTTYFPQLCHSGHLERRKVAQTQETKRTASQEAPAH